VIQGIELLHTLKEKAGEGGVLPWQAFAGSFLYTIHTEYVQGQLCGVLKGSELSEVLKGAVSRGQACYTTHAGPANVCYGLRTGSDRVTNTRQIRNEYTTNTQRLH
jgi:hypothetical protein